MAESPQSTQSTQSTLHAKLHDFLNPFLSGVAGVAAVFCLVLSTLLISNWLNLRTLQPTQHPALEALQQRLLAEPRDSSLREEIRVLDLMLRRAYFTKRWQVVTAGYILTGGLAVLLGSLLLKRALQRKLPVPGKGASGESVSREHAAARWLTAGVGLLPAGLALVLAFSTGSLVEPAPEAKAAGVTQKSTLAEAETQPSQTSPPGTPITRYTPEEVAGVQENWPAFRGPGGIAVAANGTAPRSWNGKSGQGILWKKANPAKGFNSPIIWDNYLFLSGGDENGCFVYCLAADSGKQLWQQEVIRPAAVYDTLPEISDDTGYAAPTMATDGKYVFALFATGDLAAFDFQGNPAWQRNLGMPDINYGHASSLQVYNQALIVQYDQPESARLLILDCATGGLLQEIEREVMSSWASPAIAELAGDPVLLLNGNPEVTAYDLLSGKRLWSNPCMNGEVAPSPAYAAGTVLACNDFSALVALDLTTGEQLWEFYDDLPNVASPAANNDLVFVATSYGIVTCLDRATGEILWVQEFDEGFYASPLLIGDAVYLLNLTGTMQILAAAAEYRLLGSCELGEEAVSTPAFARNRLYIRGEKNLFCIGGKDG